MKKIKIISFLAGLFLPLLLQAIPAKPVVGTITLADGSQVEVMQRGDEKFHYFQTLTGQNIIEKDGRYQTISAGELSSLQQAVKAERALLSRAQEEEEDYTIPSIPALGERHIPVILVEYADVKFVDSSNIVEEMEKHCNADSLKSVGQYFRDQSQGKYNPKFDIYGPVTLSHTQEYYGKNDRNGMDVHLGEMVAESAKLVDAEVDYSKYDTDNDGQCDVVIVIYAGEGENSGLTASSSTIWPCQWFLSQTDFKKPVAVDGVEIDNFAVFNEASRDYQGGPLHIDGIGTFCHEFSHCLGLPDLYPTDDSMRSGMDKWSVMDFGSYNDNSRTPLGYSAYEKSFVGWLELEEPFGENSVTLQPLNNSICTNQYPDPNRALVLYNDADRNEYFILEARSKMGWDEFMPAEGLMITHITFDAKKWYDNEVNNYYIQGVTLVPADNNFRTFPESALEGDLYPYGGNNRFTDDSRPAAETNLGGNFLHKPVTDIILNQDRSVSLKVNGGESEIENVIATNTDKITYYDLSGREILKPLHGIVIRKQGNKVQKVLIH